MRSYSLHVLATWIKWSCKSSFEGREKMRVTNYYFVEVSISVLQTKGGKTRCVKFSFWIIQFVQWSWSFLKSFSIYFFPNLSRELFALSTGSDDRYVFQADYFWCSEIPEYFKSEIFFLWWHNASLVKVNHGILVKLGGSQGPSQLKIWKIVKIVHGNGLTCWKMFQL